MTISVSQSSIAELRDQLCLDYADGIYLNVVSANLGIARPLFGFSDATWRALVKVLSLQYKQVVTKFEQIIEVILGPKITQCSSFAVACTAGDLTAVLVGTSQFPQVGTMLIDEGLGTEETVVYEYIDRYTNTVYFATALQFAHAAIKAEWETGIVSATASGATTRVLFDTSGLPDPGDTYTVNIGRGTPYEFTDILTAVDSMPSRKVTLTTGTAAANPGVSTSAGACSLLTPTITQPNTLSLSLQSVEILPPELGHLQGVVGATYTADSGSTTTVVISTPTLTDSAYVGFSVRFTGNVTAALRGAVAEVSGNDTTTFTFYTTLSNAPASGDTFVLLDTFQYLRVDTSDDSILRRTELPDLATFAASTKFSIVRPTLTLAIAQVQVVGVGWDVIQSSKDHVEILLPADLLANDVRTASYLRETGLITGGMTGLSTATSPRSIGDFDAEVDTTDKLPFFGVLTQTGGFQNAYVIPHTWLTAEAAIGDTTLSVVDTSLFPAAGGTLGSGGSVAGAYTIIDGTTLGIAALGAALRVGEAVYDEYIITFPNPLRAPIVITDSLDFYAFYDSGDLWGAVDDVWPGPYMFNIFDPVRKKEVTPGTKASTYLSGPTKLAVDRLAGHSVFELENASAFPAAPPYSLLVGENSGNLETLTIQSIALKQRTHTVLASQADPGEMSLTVSSLSGPGPGATFRTFPDAGPYRVVLWNTAGDTEVVEVIGTDTGPNRLLLSTAVVGTFATATTRVSLLADLVHVSPAASDDHLGIVEYANRFITNPPVSQYAQADLARPLITTVTLSTAGTDFPAAGGDAVFNFGTAVGYQKTAVVTATAGTPTVVCADASTFPSSGYPYIVTVGSIRGPLYAERVHVTNRTGNTLTISNNLEWTHTAGLEYVEFQPGPEENISYTSRSGGVLTFSPYLELENTHQVAELLAPTVGTNYPRRNGFDFPLRLPISSVDRLQLIIDMVRAAGVLVTYITKR